jgi:hypothetical protein
MQTSHALAIKEYENKLVNFELPGNKHWVDEIDKIYSQIKDKISGISNNYLSELKMARMNTNVEAIITNFVNELLELQPSHTHLSAVVDHNSNRFKNRATPCQPYRSQRMVSLVKEPVTDQSVISEDYKLLSKSIEKLKQMEKEIDKSSGSYLKKKSEEEYTTHNKSICLDQSSLLGLDKSKSRRKRIFQ